MEMTEFQGLGGRYLCENTPGVAQGVGGRLPDSRGTERSLRMGSRCIIINDNDLKHQVNVNSRHCVERPHGHSAATFTSTLCTEATPVHRC